MALSTSGGPVNVPPPNSMLTPVNIPRIVVVAGMAIPGPARFCRGTYASRTLPCIAVDNLFRADIELVR